MHNTEDLKWNLPTFNRAKAAKMPQPKREEEVKWKYVNVPEFLLEQVDKIVDADRYPEGRWHGRADFVIVAIKDKVRQLEDRRSEEVSGETIKQRRKKKRLNSSG
jgi:metal-responsive CopG/Arc/MetJ family transcriptional regulator